ncbi:uncharacterized protein LOC134525560 isoform X2 [Chroicocephalus ridibundus]|uniref:uncharacterized protein LOC134525560 isoform X2 n=1 Tax=Chroicocephalus ridibundus TaxID=1192867 RepID=UPI002FDC8758
MGAIPSYRAANSLQDRDPPGSLCPAAIPAPTARDQPRSSQPAREEQTASCPGKLDGAGKRRGAAFERGGEQTCNTGSAPPGSEPPWRGFQKTEQEEPLAALGEAGYSWEQVEEEPLEKSEIQLQGKVGSSP